MFLGLTGNDKASSKSKWQKTSPN